jgi:hypothetical protein
MKDNLLIHFDKNKIIGLDKQFYDLDVCKNCILLLKFDKHIDDSETDKMRFI